jgi:hypothetical protein
VRIPALDVAHELPAGGEEVDRNRLGLGPNVESFAGDLVWIEHSKELPELRAMVRV